VNKVLAQRLLELAQEKAELRRIYSRKKPGFRRAFSLSPLFSNMWYVSALFSNVEI
jgi:hypothetical protein